METNGDVLKTVKALTSERPFRAERLKRALGQELHPVPAESNDFFEVFRATDAGSPLFREIEVRVPKAGSGAARDGIVVLTVQPRICVVRAEVTERFGSSPEISVPTPREPPDSPIYLVYRQPWGSLRFGMERGGRECLKTVVLDATRQ